MESNDRKSPCGGCPKAVNGVNGLWCAELKINCEHALSRPCGKGTED